MIIYRTGDVVEAFKKGEIDVLVHQCNAQGVMGSGIAKQIKDTFPEAFKDYKRIHTKNGKLKLGESIITNLQNKDSKHCAIVNLIAQDHYFPRGIKHTSYDAIDKGMEFIFKWMAFDNTRIGMPKIGAGLGGGDWKVIEAIINSHFKDRDVFVYELKIQNPLEEKQTSGKNDLG